MDSTHAPDKKPISPQQLFNRLLAGHWKQIQCDNHLVKVKEERQILLQLIAEYRAQIDKTITEQDQFDSLLELRGKLRGQLEQVRVERKEIDRNLQCEIHRLKIEPVPQENCSKLTCQLECLRAKNAKMEIRLRELNDYCQKIINSNNRLQQQNIYGREDARYRSFMENVQDTSWMINIQNLRKQHMNHSEEMRRRMKQKEDRSLMEIRDAETQIHNRNRQRMSSFHEKPLRRHYY